MSKFFRAVTTLFVMTLLATSIASSVPLVPQAVVDGIGASNISTATITRPANTTQYTANTAWANATSGATYSTFQVACRFNQFLVLIPQIDIYSSVNPGTKLQGILWLFSNTVAVPINDNAAFTIGAADYAKLTGNVQGFPFTLVSNQSAGAANSGISLTGVTYHGACGTTAGYGTIYGMVQVVNTYTPGNAEVLTIKLHTIAVN